MSEGSMIDKDGVRIIQGTPTAPLTGPTLFLRMLRVSQPGQPERTRASLAVARPRAGGYLIKELIPDMELDPRAALDKAVAIAKRGEIAELYLNAKLEELPTAPVAAFGG